MIFKIKQILRFLLKGSNFQQTAHWLACYGKTPDKSAYQHKDVSTQIGCDFEEIAEFLGTISCTCHDTNKELHNLAGQLYILSKKIQKGNKFVFVAGNDREACLDSICDREVTANGVAYMLGFDKDLADSRVIDSNWAKLVNKKPLFEAGGKIKKPDSWKPPKLSDCI